MGEYGVLISLVEVFLDRSSNFRSDRKSGDDSIPSFWLSGEELAPPFTSHISYFLLAVACLMSSSPGSLRWWSLSLLAFLGWDGMVILNSRLKEYLSEFTRLRSRRDWLILLLNVLKAACL